MDPILQIIQDHPLPSLKGAHDAFVVVERFRASLLAALRAKAPPAVAPGVSSPNLPECLPPAKVV